MGSAHVTFLTIIYIYFIFTIINIFFTYRSNCTEKRVTLTRRDGLGLVRNALGWIINKRLGRVEQVTIRRVRKSKSED